MDKKEVIEFLKQRSNEAAYIGSLSYNNNEYLPWRRNIEDVLESAFGVNSTEYKRVADVHKETRGTRAAIQRAYVALVHRIQQEVESIIQKYEVLGIGTEPEPKQELKDATALPIDVFDKIQFHPKVAEASRQLFKDGHYRDAIYRAFVAVNNYVKVKSNTQLDGKGLMSTAFSLSNPIIKINPLITQTDKDEQEGFMYLFMGAMEGIRNPKAHENIIQNDPHRTLEYLGLASLLMQIAETGTVKKTRPPRQRWNLEKFLTDAQERCNPERTEIMKKLIDFTVSNSDAGILWGTGTKYGSFVFQKLIENIPVSIFQVYTDGTFFLFFSPMKNKGVDRDTLDQFRLNLNTIPGVRISEKVISERNKYGSLGLNTLVRPNSLKLFQEAVLSLCRQLDLKGA